MKTKGTIYVHAKICYYIFKKKKKILVFYISCEIFSSSLNTFNVFPEIYFSLKCGYKTGKLNICTSRNFTIFPTRILLPRYKVSTFSFLTREAALISYKFDATIFRMYKLWQGAWWLAESQLKISGKARINVYENNKDSFILLTWNLKYFGKQLGLDKINVASNVRFISKSNSRICEI